MLYNGAQSMSDWLCQIFFVKIVLWEISRDRTASSKSGYFGKSGNNVFPFL